MRKFLLGGMAALTFATGALAPVAEAQARDRYYYRYHRHHDDDGAALAAGIAGLAIGAALASGSSHRGYYDDGPRIYRYQRGYYDGPQYYRPRSYDGYYAYERPRSCRTTSYYDDWDGRYMERTRCW